MVRPSLINLNHVELKYYPFMISIDKYSRSCNAWYAKISVLKQAKDVNIKAFNIIANKNEAKAMENIFHMIVNAVSLKQYVSGDKWNNKTCQCECKKYRTYKK